MAHTRMYSFDKTLSDGRVVSVCIPRMPHLRANITYRCDRGCPNCNRACGVAKSSTAEDMAVSDFQQALKDIAEAGTKLTKIILTGGEPSLHPDLVSFADAAMSYKKDHSPDCNVWIATYRHPKYFHRVEEALQRHKQLAVQGDPKTKPRIHNYATYLAPIDDPLSDPRHFYRGCHLNASLCGMTVDYHGFWCCPVAPAIARVFGLDLAVKSYKSVSIETLTAQYDQACRYCGYYKSCKVKRSGEPMSKSWIEAVKAYSRKQLGHCK